jgi:outer membrane protein insertion porin family
MGDGAAEIGDKLSPKNLIEFENRLQATGLFSTVDLKSLGENLEMVGDKALVDYQVDVKERAGGSLELGPGFRSDLGFVGFAEFAYRNIGGWNRGAFIKSTLSHKLQRFQFLEQDYSFSFIEPYPLGFRARLRFDARYKLSDDIQYENGGAIAGFNKEETSFSSKLEKRFSEHFTTIVTLYTYELPRIFNKITEPNQSTQKYQLGGNGLEFLLDYRDNIFNPLKGWFLSQNVEYYSPLMGSLSGVNFVSSSTRFNKYFHLGQKAVLALSLGYDHLWGIGEDAIIPENKRLVLGGRTSLRFLSENFLRFDEGGVTEQQAILGRLEYRVPLFLDFGMASFFEMGEVDVLRDQSPKGKRSTGLRSGAGFGFRYGTPVGPISVDWAYNLGARDKENDYRITLSIGTF